MRKKYPLWGKPAGKNTPYRGISRTTYGKKYPLSGYFHAGVSKKIPPMGVSLREKIPPMEVFFHLHLQVEVVFSADPLTSVGLIALRAINQLDAQQCCASIFTRSLKASSNYYHQPKGRWKNNTPSGCYFLRDNPFGLSFLKDNPFRGYLS